MGEFRNWFNLSTKEIALIAVLSSVWITSQIYLGPIVGRITRMHGMVNRVVGWFLMLILAELTGKFGRVSIMATTATLATRIIRQSALEGLIVGSGYAFGGLTFDLLFFMPVANNFKGKTRNAYLLTISVVSGAVATIPYLLSKIFFLGFYGFIAWIVIPVNALRIPRNLILSFLGVFVGLPVLPQIKVWSLRKDVQRRKVLVR